MEQERANSFLETERIPKLMRRYSVPCVVSLLVAALYNIVDQIFIANAPYLGSNGNAANTVVFPLTVVALAVAVMIGDGCCAFVSLSLGAGEGRKAGRAVGNAVVLCAGAGLAVTAAYFAFADALLTVFGGRVNGETFAFAKEYFKYIAMGVPLYMFGQAMNPVIRSDGSPRFAMASTLAGAVANLILDPVMILGFRWGMMGAAVATVIGQALTAGLSVWYLCRMKSVKLDRSCFRLDWTLIRRFIPLGVCSLLSQLSLVAAMAAINNMVRSYGAADPVFGQAQYAQIPMAVIGIVMKFFQIVISVVIGMAAGCIPIVGYNVGSGRRDRARELLTLLLVLETALGVLALIAAEAFPGRLIGLFGAANESAYYTEFAKKSFRVYLCLLPLACVNKAAFIYLQSLGEALASTLLSMARELVFGVGFALLLPVFFGLDGVLLSMPVSDALTFLISVFVLRRTYAQLREPASAGAAPAPVRSAP